MRVKGHPIQVVQDLVAASEGELIFQFSKYFYRPQSILDEREVFFVEGSRVTEDWLDKEMRALAPGWELAIGSKVKDSRGRNWQIPMADLSIESPGDGEFALLRQLVPPQLWRRGALYNSGRSYHLYFRKLIHKGEWTEFMGRLLLANLPSRSPITDSRWIGHRLLAGYGSLRWSANSTHHDRPPVRVDMPRV